MNRPFPYPACAKHGRNILLGIAALAVAGTWSGLPWWLTVPICHFFVITTKVPTSVDAEMKQRKKP